MSMFIKDPPAENKHEFWRGFWCAVLLMLVLAAINLI